MRFKVLTIILFTLLFSGTVFTTIARAEGGEGGGNVQTPVQVIVQIIITAIALRILGKFDLP